MLGPMLGGLVVAALSPAWAITVDACTFAVSAVCISRIAIPAHIRRQEQFLAAMRDGWCEVRSRNWLALSIGAFSLYQFFAMATFFVLGPVAARRHFDGATTWAAVITALGIGSIVGAIAAALLEIGVATSRPIQSSRLQSSPKATQGPLVG